MNNSTLQHLAIIMDGNGRWANQRGRPRFWGHVKGAQVARDVIEHSVRLGIKNLTLYTFSSENWSRPPQEIIFLMQLLKKYLLKEAPKLFKNNIKFNCIGDIDKLPDDVRSLIVSTMKETSQHSGMNLNFAISYGGRQEILSACNQILADVNAGKITTKPISAETFEKYLFTHPCPHPDLIIRTGGESRLSNFLTWQSAYSELFFSKTLWPNFSLLELDYALEFYQSRERRFGKTSTQILSEQPLQ